MGDDKCEHGDDQLACLLCHAMFSDPSAPRVPESFFNRVVKQRDALRAQNARLREALDWIWARLYRKETLTTAERDVWAKADSARRALEEG